ncbi:Txe/YoeB family addiction module toxin [Aequorivita antarctica]|uniref:Putative mRNA interferase YoeB n=1 Tax=Aequorivita antarctica TaxID=153266 RepID=A0A5C6YUY5_9FLAO|nr:Txe/YoeB family addiction module toxin [Aequorivita antarctica]TXD71408.1 Txe/YoeB family addiction module toxin [Aequorivita antarctica]SRX76426.1 Toxin YoeB [Aequorivita antarctica]
MEITYTENAINDISYWKKSGDKTIQNKITKLLKSIEETPFEGIGKPELLKYELTGFWSRRINKEHRLVYKLNEDTITIYSLRGHY